MNKMRDWLKDPLAFRWVGALVLSGINFSWTLLFAVTYLTAHSRGGRFGWGLLILQTYLIVTSVVVWYNIAGRMIWWWVLAFCAWGFSIGVVILGLLNPDSHTIIYGYVVFGATCPSAVILGLGRWLSLRNKKNPQGE